MPKAKSKKQNVLTLGWEVDESLNPKYWMLDHPKLGLQKVSDLVQIPASSIGHHTAIIAQSGSGKSFFLGRLIEEIILNTQCRCIIFDPNSDFKKIYLPESKELWSDVSFNRETKSGRLPDTTRHKFVKMWENISIIIQTHNARYQQDDHFQDIKINWTSISSDFLAEDLDSVFKSEVFHCHKFIDAISELLTFKKEIPEFKQLDYFEEAERLLKFPKRKLKDNLLKEFDYDVLIKSIGEAKENVSLFTRSDISIFIEKAIREAQYISIDVAKYYFGKASEIKSSGVIAIKNDKSFEIPKMKSRIQVIDLPSIKDNQIRLMAINAILSKEWDSARNRWNRALKNPKEEDERVPTFLIVDEAHNLIPEEPKGKAEFLLRDQFRTIVSEGRKFGLFLIIVSQRPDKVDQIVLTECENKVVMKLSNSSVLRKTKELLGLEDIDAKKCEKCLGFGIGRGLIYGPWVKDELKFFYSAARRTVEGGRNLREKFWAQSPFVSDPKNPTG